MKPIVVERSVQSSEPLASASFSFDMGNVGMFFSLVRDKMYSNKPLAVLREYAANAWDAHRAAGKADVPIKVTLPTELDCAVTIRDFGLGMSEEFVFRRYIFYMDSSKRETDSEVGSYGLGCKAGFAYNDQFTVTSWHDGTKSIYMAVLDASNVGEMRLLYRGECPLDETGVEIKVPVNPRDRSRFINEAKELFRWFSPRPIINTELALPFTGSDVVPRGVLRKARLGLHTWTAVMGCIPYPIDFRSIREDLTDAETLEVLDVVDRLCGVINFDIGELSVSASRESLEYTDRTQKALLRGIKELVEEESKELLAAVQSNATEYERRLELRRGLQVMGLNPPIGYKEMAAFKVPLYAEGERVPGLAFFSLAPSSSQGSSRRTGTLTATAQRTVEVTYRLRFVIQDTSSPLSWYFTQRERDLEGLVLVKATQAAVAGVVAAPLPLVDANAVEALLRDHLKSLKLDGAPIKMLSSLPSEAPPKRARTVRKHKYSQRLFTFNADTAEYGSKPSDFWSAAEDAMPSKGVFVIISQFNVFYRGNQDLLHPQQFLRRLREEREIFRECFGEALPPIYGIKTTPAKPVRADDVKGVRYLEWLCSRYRHHVHAPPIQEVLETRDWYHEGKSFLPSGRRDLTEKRRVLETQLAKLEPRHPIRIYYNKAIEATDVVLSLNNDQRHLVEVLASERTQRRAGPRIDKRLKDPQKIRHALRNAEKIPRESEVMLDKIYARYPLMDPKHGGPGVMRGLGTERSGSLWAEYIQIVDAKTPKKRKK